MNKIPYIISEVCCIKCRERWIACRPVGVMLKDIECANCGKGFVIETGETIKDINKNGERDE